MPYDFDLIVIGAGPGGYVAAIRAAQLGWSVACVDKHHNLGGTCLRIGCIPSKALLESSEHFEFLQTGLADHGVRAGKIELNLSKLMARKERIVAGLTGGVRSLLKKNQVTSIQGEARLLGGQKVSVRRGDEEDVISAATIILAVGSRPAGLPGVKIDEDRIGSSTAALAYDRVPNRLLVIGAGYIGLELGSVWRRLGAEVAVVEALPRILPGMDAEIADLALRLFEKQGLHFSLNHRVESVQVRGKECRVKLSSGETLKSDRVLVAVGRVPHTQSLDLEKAGVNCDEKGRIEVDQSFATSAQGVYAIGDCIAGPMLAHKASEEGIACVEQLIQGYGEVNYDTIPAVVYTHPEIASVGKTEDELSACRTGRFSFRNNGRALTLGQTDGFIKILSDEKTDRILGVHIIGPRAGDLIAEAAAAMEFGATSEDLARCCHAHPTLAEAFQEAALAVDNRGIHQ